MNSTVALKIGILPLIVLVPLIVLIGFALLSFWIWMLIDCVNNESVDDPKTTTWLALLICLPVLGALFYFLFRRRRRMSRLPA